MKDDPKLFRERSISVSYSSNEGIMKQQIQKELETKPTASSTLSSNPEKIQTRKGTVDLNTPPSRSIPQPPVRSVSPPPSKPAPKLPSTPKPVESVKKEPPPLPRTAKPITIPDQSGAPEKSFNLPSKVVDPPQVETLIHQEVEKPCETDQSKESDNRKVDTSSIKEDDAVKIKTEEMTTKASFNFKKEEQPETTQIELIQEGKSKDTPSVKQEKREEEKIVLKENSSQNSNVNKDTSLPKLSCSKCGTFATNDKAKFCNFCGSNLIERTTLSSNRKPVFSGRKAPQKNAVRERNKVSEQNKSVEGSVETKKNSSGIQVGGFGKHLNLADFQNFFNSYFSRITLQSRRRYWKFVQKI